MIWNKIIAFKEGKTEVGCVEAAVKNHVAYFNIVGRIWSWTADKESLFRKQVEDTISKGITKAVVEGSSEGGSVFATNDMKALLDKYDTVEIKVNALMASAFTYLTSHFHTTIKANTQGMIHMPIISAKGNVKDVESMLKLGKNVTEDYAKAYAKKTGKTVKQIKALWSSGDYWMNAQELLAEGFVDAIEGEVEAFSESDISSLAACGAPIIPEVTSETKPKQKPNTKIMDKEELIAFLGLDSNATDAQITAAKSKMKADALKQRSQEEADKNKSETEAEAKAETLVDAAITAKKITADQKETFMDLATANYEAADKAFKSMPNREKLSANLTPSDGLDADEKLRANWTLEDYLTKDPEALEKMMADEPKKAAALEAPYFGKH
ncbi:MAG: ATP-dependent Clp protease proteolytic subunit [Oceanihabitans sp.]